MKSWWIILLGVFSGLCAYAQPVADRLLNPDSIQRIFLQDPDRALQLLDTAEQRDLPTLQPFDIAILRAMAYDVKRQYTQIEHYAQLALKDDSVRLVPKRRLRVMSLLLDAQGSLSKYDKCIKVCQEAVELARSLGNVKLEGRILLKMANVYFRMGHLEQTEAYYRESIKLMSTSEDVRVLAELSTGYGEMLNVYTSLKMYKEAIHICYEREKLIQRMSTMQGPPPGYIDQQYGYLYSKMAYVLQLDGQEEEAADAYRHFLATDYSTYPFGRGEGIPYLLAAHRYEEALKLTQKDDLPMADTINYQYLIVLDRYAQAYRGLGDYRLADAYQQRCTVLSDSIYAREREAQAQEYAVIFDLNEKELQLSEAEAEVQQNRVIVISACIVILLLLVLLWTVWRNLKRTRERNRIAVRQIDELVAQREELRKVFFASQMKDDNTPAAEENGQPERETEDEDGIRTNYAAFMRMEQMIIKERLFLQPKFGREDLLRLTHIGKNDLVAFLQKHGNVENVSDYVNHLRAEYAVKLMKEKPLLSIEAIAEESGFSSRSTFYRAFYKVFGMTPTQYVKANDASATEDKGDTL